MLITLTLQNLTTIFEESKIFKFVSIGWAFVKDIAPKVWLLDKNLVAWGDGNR